MSGRLAAPTPESLTALSQFLLASIGFFFNVQFF